MKKFAKIFGIILLIFIALLFILPIIFEGKIIELVKKTANNNINATLDFKDADISLFRSFPSAEVRLNDLYIANKAPFEGDTLVKAGNIDLKLPFKSLFQGTDKPVNVTSFTIDNANISIKVDRNGNANYDIAKDSDNSGNESENSDPFTFDLNSYAITNSAISYYDESNRMLLKVNNLNHSGNGNLSANESILHTSSDALVSFEYDSISYLKNNTIKLDADLKLDLQNNTYTFLENKALINQLPLVFDGFVKVNENNQEIDLKFETPSSDFKNFLALIPETYSKNIEGVTTTGNFDVKGVLKGVIDDEHIPTFDVTIASDNASFKYPDLPKSLQNIVINTQITNTTGLTKDTYVNINKLAFKIDEDTFSGDAKLTNITENMNVNAGMHGTINLANLEKIYPADGLKGLKGLLKADAVTSFDMQSIENKRYENTKTSGSFDLSNFEFTSEELTNPLKISKTSLTFSPTTVALNQFDAQLGQTDISAKGTIHNLLGFMFNKENIEGKFSLASNTFAVNDFMTTSTENAPEEAEKPTGTEEKLQIPSFLDCTIDAKANKVLYDNIALNNVSGTLVIKDQQAKLNNMRSDVFGGTLGFNGLVSTQKETPEFQMNLDVKNFDIAESFTSLELFKALAPIANAVKGKINTDITLSGNLNDDFTPNLSTLSGNILAQLLSSSVATESSPLLQKLEQNVTFLDAKKLNLDALKASLTFKDGKVAVKPFTLNYEDIQITVAGGHGFDKSVDYDAVINVPAKYLGKEAATLIAQLSDDEKNTIKVPVTALIKGSFTNPTITTDLKSAVTDLTKQVANNQKDKLVNQGKDKLNSALEGLLNKNKTTDSTKVDSTKTQQKDNVKNAAKGLLNNLLGSKKKKDTVN